jgi:hypothetical protein
MVEREVLVGFTPALKGGILALRKIDVWVIGARSYRRIKLVNRGDCVSVHLFSGTWLETDMFRLAQNLLQLFWGRLASSLYR